jgi:hypothetical protein
MQSAEGQPASKEFLSWLDGLFRSLEVRLADMIDGARQHFGLQRA